MDRDLVEAAQDGDREAFVDLIRARSDRLFAIAQRILRDVDRAEDALQDALVIAWRDLRGPPRSGPLRRVAPAPPHQRLHRPGDARASPDREPSGAAGRRTGRARRPAHRRPTGTSSNAGSAGCRPTSGRSSCSITTSGTSRPRSPRRSASRPARPALDSITPIAPCAPPSRRTLGPRSRKVDRHEPARDIERLLDHWFADGPTDGPRPGHRRRRRPHRASTPATRLAPPTEAPHDEHLRQDRGRVAAVVLIVAVVGYNLLPGRSTGVGGARAVGEPDGRRPTATPATARPPTPSA